MRGKYFYGRLADDKGSIRLVGFDLKKQQEMNKICESQQALCLENCQVSKSKFSDEMEVIVTKISRCENILTFKVLILPI